MESGVLIPNLVTLFADETFDPGNLEDFDGRRWGDVRLDDTTRDEFKRRYRTKGGSFIRPSATIIDTRNRGDWDMQALQDGTSGSSRITGFYLIGRDGGRRLDSVARNLGRGQRMYSQVRFSDWFMQVFPDNGIALCVVREDDYRVPYAVLTTQRRLERIMDKARSREPDIDDPRRAFNRLSRDVMIGNTSVSITKRDIRPDYQDDMLRRYSDRLRNNMDRGVLAYQPGASGSASILFSIYCSDGNRDNRVEANGSVNGKNERGNVSASAYTRVSLDRNKSRAENQLNRAIDDAFYRCSDDLRRNTENAVNDQQPPSIPELRRQSFFNLFDSATR